MLLRGVEVIEQAFLKTAPTLNVQMPDNASLFSFEFPPDAAPGERPKLLAPDLTLKAGSPGEGHLRSVVGLLPLMGGPERGAEAQGTHCSRTNRNSKPFQAKCCGPDTMARSFPAPPNARGDNVLA